MARILVSGLINIETTLRIEKFPLEYNPVNYPFGGVASTISGVGINVARALQILGHEVTLVSMVGRDPAGRWVREQLKRWKLSDACVVEALDATPQSVILYDQNGRRQIHVDLKTIQETEYPPEGIHNILSRNDLAVLCNINFSRRLIEPVKKCGLTLATDVHALSNFDDSYNRDFMAAADILFMSHEHLPASPPESAEKIARLYGNQVIVIGMGAHGALIKSAGPAASVQLPVAPAPKIVNTIGAGDALFSGFLHGWVKRLDPVAALRQAMVFASWKIGFASASEGFLDADALAEKM